ncbi:MAG: MBL fold metallo-hydrolase [Verrucomicrobiota bacterium JB023]|nr:MBL fold metallo-hydrolase [Verrucomicrobiota bacterium JB023]
MLSLEDNFDDILGKALRGMNMTPEQLSSLSGVSPEQIKALLDGQPDDAALRKVAPALGLHGETLVERAGNKWHPEQLEIEGLRQITTPFEDFSVNSYLIWDPHTMESALFDTGTSGEEAHSLYQALGLKVTDLYFTHTHIDHIMAIEEIEKWATPKMHSCALEPVDGSQTFQPGDQFKLGRLSISTRLTRGHSPAGITYFIEGLEQPVAIVGDAIFCQSMGGGVVSYQDALDTNRSEILTLPDETIICPGHGPMSTVGQEKAHNPFFPEFKS